MTNILFVTQASMTSRQNINFKLTLSTDSVIYGQDSIKYRSRSLVSVKVLLAFFGVLE